MPLWGNTDTANSAPKFLRNGTTFPAANTAQDYNGLQRERDINNAFFVDVTEAGVAANRAAGLKTPGWNMYKTYGAGRKYVETLVAMKVSAALAGDFGVSGNTAIEDATVPDA